MLIVLHVLADVVWIGSILAVALLLVRGPGDARQRGAAGRLVYRVLAAPSFGVALLAGLARLGQNPEMYFKDSHYMHAKLPLALGVITLHHIIGARCRKMEAGEAQDAGPTGPLAGALALLAAAVVVLVVLKPF